MCTQSFSKNFGLYNERVGNLIVVMSDTKELAQVKSQLTLIVRGMYSNPPNHGARLVATVLQNPDLFKQWYNIKNKIIKLYSKYKYFLKISKYFRKSHMITMSTRIKEMRVCLYEKLVQKGTPGVWDHITKQIGMFCYTGLTG